MNPDTESTLYLFGCLAMFCIAVACIEAWLDRKHFVAEQDDSDPPNPDRAQHDNEDEWWEEI